jgi:hypothetical protein
MVALTGSERKAAVTRRRRLLLSGVLASIFILGIAPWLLWPCTAITRANAAKIKEGMTLAEVEAVLAGPCRDDSSGPLCADGPDWEADDLEASWYQNLKLMDGRLVWGSDNVIIVIRLDDDERVLSSASIPVRRVRESPLDIIRRWLRL